MDLKYTVQLLFILCFLSLCLREGLSCRFEDKFADLSFGKTFFGLNQPNVKNKRIVMVHGLLGDSTQFYDWRCIFSHAGYQVLTYDLLGHGNSEWRVSGFLSQEKFAAHLNELLISIGWVDDQNNAIERFTLLGVSMGGLISIKYALAHPNHISNLILMCPPGIMTKHDLPELYKLSNSNFAHLVKNIHSSKRMFRCGFYCASKLGIVKLNKQTKKEKKEMINNYHKTFSTYVKSGGDGSLFYRHLDFENLAKYEDQFKIIFFWGINDETVPLAPAVDFLSKYYTKTPIVVYPNIKHIPLYPILSPALATLDFLESNFTVGVPLNQVKSVGYFYDNEVNIVQGLNYTFSGEDVLVRMNSENFTEEYIDFLNISSS
ncbi:hydrolase [Cryptosporidium sp. chipmunk genotype I]|uniref:hydrolase n=1 Tax=Cryptosporidium sp. chipmunk genotype I TaxID=1280935 RepID=UPI00351A0A84|nr:hydrolase [Cryptosporidium sp. chipmunk genotype I]